GARSATVATEAVAAHAHRVGALERFDRRVEGVGHAGVDAAHAGEALHGALSAAERLVVHPAVAADDHVVHRPLRRSADHVGCGLGEGAETNVGYALADLDVAGAHGYR